MKLATSRGTALAVVVSILAVAAIVYVQYHRIPGNVENIVRAVIRTSGWLAPPVLILLSCRAWIKLVRATLPVWRNGLALAAIVLLSCNWLFAIVLLALASTGPTRIMFFNAEWMATLLYSAVAGALLGCALRGTARTYMIAAALLMWAYWQSGIYI